uniref:Retrovirus-related Pol polyprotein from transposon TNT 1-94 n=1 Tax=Cajanus cajan TaxID=3821 RepID=A0A151QMX7_CAJCA|nr:Retrovirus-related Pol polyprotein from transposon TNT 1-94 [Cajanus cajan]
MHKKRDLKTYSANTYGSKSIWVLKIEIVSVADHNFSTPRTPQQNRVVERKNRSLKEMARTLLNDFSTSKHFWEEAVNTSCYVQNRIYIRPILKKTPYELWKGQAPNISYFHPFGCKCFILNTKDNLGKFDSKIDEGILLGYSERSRAYRVFNNRTKNVKEAIHVKFDENKPDNYQSWVISSRTCKDEFEKSMMGKLKFFLGIQIVQSDEGIKIHLTKYTKELLQKFKMEDAKPMKTSMHPSTTLGLDEDSPDVDSTFFSGL